MRNSLSDAHPFSKIIFALFIILASFLITFILGFLIAIPIFHISISNLSVVLSDYNDPDNIRFLKYLQSLQAIGLFIIPAFLIAYVFNSKAIEYLRFNNSITSKSILFTVIILFAIIPIINFLAILNQSMQLPEFLHGLEAWMKEQETNGMLITEAFLKMDSVTGLLFNIFMIGILPAIGEELIFRGIFQRLFAEWTKNIHWGIIIAAVLFSAMHVQFYGFLPRVMLGIVLGYLFYWSGSIWIPIAGHFTNNTVAVIFYYFYADKITEEIDTIGASWDSIGYLVLSLVIVASFLYFFYKENKKSRIEGS